MRKHSEPRHPLRLPPNSRLLTLDVNVKAHAFCFSLAPAKIRANTLVARARFVLGVGIRVRLEVVGLEHPLGALGGGQVGGFTLFDLAFGFEVVF
jgi:hypothetical protein